MDFKLEVIAFNPDCCINIQEAGAQRIELCSNPAEGGTTPSHGMISVARKNVSIHLFPIIRPRGGDFLYNATEFKVMMKDVEFCLHTGCDGVVIGMLNADGTVDKKRCKSLIEIAYPMSVTFHRAFDRTSDPFQALEDIIDIGCERILTSGLQPTAIEGIHDIEKIIKQADERIIIMPGSGIRSENIVQIAETTKAIEFHTSARKFAAGKMEYVNKNLKEELTVNADVQEIRNMVNLLTQVNETGG